MTKVQKQWFVAVSSVVLGAALLAGLAGNAEAAEHKCAEYELDIKAAVKAKGIKEPVQQCKVINRSGENNARITFEIKTESLTTKVTCDPISCK